MPALSNLHILITRPTHQARALTQAIQSLDGKPIAYPTLEIIPARNTELLKSVIAELDQYTWIIFISANAVWQSVSQIKQCWLHLPKTLKMAAIGEVTAQCLLDAGFPVHAYPKIESSSEQLLDLPEFHSIQGQKILIMGGEGGRELLETTLTNRGAQLKKAVAYHRIRPQPVLTCEQLKTLSIDIVIVTSTEGLINLYEMIGEKARQWLLQLPLLVMSDRIKLKAQTLGFQRILVAKQTADSGLIDTLCDWNQTRE